MLQRVVSNFFDIRKGEFNSSLFMFLYIFIVIAVLMIVKPTITALFLSELGAEQLPYGFVLVAIGAVFSSFLYSRLQKKYSLKELIVLTLLLSAGILLLLSILLFNNYLKSWALYFFYTWVAIYGVLSASQFWVLANVVFNIREAKRIFGFIGSGAILGGLFGGYLTSLLASYLGNEYLLLLAAVFLLLLLPILGKIWKSRIDPANEFGNVGKKAVVSPFQLLKKSKHLTNLALIVGISVLVAKLVDFLFSDYAAKSISDPDELSSFFGFWFSTFNLVSLAIQLFLTHRIVGIWGVGFSLLLLPIGIVFGSVLFLFLPELSAIVAVKAMDGVLKQSINKSAFELLALPLPTALKNNTKSFIDVVVDSFATGVAGLLLVFIIKGFEWESYQVAWLILGLVLIWAYLIFRTRNSYYETFKNNLRGTSEVSVSSVSQNKSNVLEGMRSVFKSGTEKQILFMLDKLMEINDKRFTEDVRSLLVSPSNKVKTAALKNLYFLDSHTIPVNCNDLLHSGDEELVIATLDFLLLHARNEPDAVFNQYLDHENETIASAALFTLGKESSHNKILQSRYQLSDRLEQRIRMSAGELNATLLLTIGVSKIEKYYSKIHEALSSEEVAIQIAGIKAVGLSRDFCFIEDLLKHIVKKQLRAEVIAALRNFDESSMDYLVDLVKERRCDIEVCRFVPKVLEAFANQIAVNKLFLLFSDVDLSIRLEVVRSLSNLRMTNDHISFNRFKVVNKIYEECKLYDRTLDAMHTQIIIAYRNRKKSKLEVQQEERDARASLLELLERRLDSGLERIFKLLGLKYPHEDVMMAYSRLLSEEEDERSSAIDFLDNLLTGNLKYKLFPIIEEAVTDYDSEEVRQEKMPKIPTEKECFELLLQIPDLKLRLAVLYLIAKQGDSKYKNLLEKLVADENPKIRTFAATALKQIVV